MIHRVGKRSGVWAVAGREAVEHADGDAGWKLGRRDSSLDLDPMHSGLYVLKGGL